MTITETHSAAACPLTKCHFKPSDDSAEPFEVLELQWRFWTPLGSSSWLSLLLVETSNRTHPLRPCFWTSEKMWYGHLKTLSSLLGACLSTTRLTAESYCSMEMVLCSEWSCSLYFAWLRFSFEIWLVCSLSTETTCQMGCCFCLMNSACQAGANHRLQKGLTPLPLASCLNLNLNPIF